MMLLEETLLIVQHGLQNIQVLKIHLLCQGAKPS